MGIEGHLPIIIAFAILAAYTYQSGLRAPALIAFVKDTLIYLVVIVAVIYIPTQLGGWDDIFGAADKKFKASESPTDGAHAGQHADARLRVAGVRLRDGAVPVPALDHRAAGGASRDTIKRNMAALPAYSLVLGLLALLGFMAIAADVTPLGDDANTDRPAACSTRCSRTGSRASRSRRSASARWCPRRSCRSPPPTCSRATSTRSTSSRDATPKQEARVAKIVSLFVKAGAVVGHHRARPAVLDRPAADRRRADPDDAAGDRLRPVHALVPRPGAAAGPDRRASRPACTCSTTRRTRRPARSTSAGRSTRCRSSASTPT